MKTLIGLTLALISVSAHAQENVFRSATLTPYQELQEWFAEGVDIAYAEFAPDYHIGRCFDVANQTRPTAAIVASMQRQTGEDAGPGFPGVERKIFQFTSYLGADPAIFDRFPWLPNGVDGRREFRQVAANNWRFISPLEGMNSLTHYYDMEPNGRLDDKIEIVQGREYMISKRTNLIAQHRNGRFSPAGEVLQMCYYFIRAMK